MTNRTPEAIIGEALILLNNKINTPGQLLKLQQLAKQLNQALCKKEVSK